MHKILFKLGSIEVHSYYVLWTFALSVAVIWIRRRAVRRYLVEDESARMCLIFGFIGMLIGARVGGYFDHWTYYAADPLRVLNFLEGGLSSTTAFLGAGALGIFYCSRHRLEVWRIAEAASIPAAATVAIGRIGCFLNGCCYGVTSDLSFALHFPFDHPGIRRHPTQLYYSLGASLILMILLFIEKKVGSGSRRKIKGAVLWPVFMILYGGMRFLVDFLRVGDRIMGLRTGQFVGIGVLIAGIGWLVSTLNSHDKITIYL